MTFSTHSIDEKGKIQANEGLLWLFNHGNIIHLPIFTGSGSVGHGSLGCPKFEFSFTSWASKFKNIYTQEIVIIDFYLNKTAKKELKF